LLQMRRSRNRTGGDEHSLLPARAFWRCCAQYISHQSCVCLRLGIPFSFRLLLPRVLSIGLIRLLLTRARSRQQKFGGPRSAAARVRGASRNGLRPAAGSARLTRCPFSWIAQQIRIEVNHRRMSLRAERPAVAESTDTVETRWGVVRSSHGIILGRGCRRRQLADSRARASDTSSDTSSGGLQAQYRHRQTM
jgi:hypothetical protein